MTRLLIALALAVGWLSPALAAAEGTPEPAPAKKLFPYPTHTEKLPNGLTVVVIPMRSGGLAAFWTVVRTGSRDEVEPGRSGFAHFFEHMMFRGTKKYPADVYGAKLTALGANFNASTSTDLTQYYFGIAAEDLPTVIDLESDRFQNLSYEEGAFKTEAGAVYGEYRKNRTSPFFSLYEAMRNTAFDAHTYKHTTMGYEADIKAMPTLYEYSKEFLARFYRPENCVVLVVGDVEVAPTMALIRKFYGDWKPGYVAPKVPTEPEQKLERQTEVQFSGRSLPMLWMAYKIDGFDPASRSVAATELLAELAFGETSDLYQKLVLDTQVAQVLRASGDAGRDPGLFDIIAMVKDEAKVGDVRKAIEDTIRSFQDNPPDAQRLADLKSRIKYSFLMGLDTPDSVARSLSRFIALTGGIDQLDTFYASLDGVTPADIQAAARRFLVPARRTVGILRGVSP